MAGEGKELAQRSPLSCSMEDDCIVPCIKLLICFPQRPVTQYLDKRERERRDRGWFHCSREQHLTLLVSFPDPNNSVANSESRGLLQGHLVNSEQTVFRAFW